MQNLSILGDQRVSLLLPGIASEVTKVQGPGPSPWNPRWPVAVQMEAQGSHRAVLAGEES